MNQAIAQLEASQIQTAIEVLGNAFKDDPVLREFVFQEEDRRLSAIRLICRLMLHYARPYNTVYATTGVLKGVAIWIPPNQFPLNDFKLLQLGGYKLPFKVRFSRLRQFIALFLKIEARHKVNTPEPHWYLLMLGVAPLHQNQGVGSSLIQPILERADRENLPCYLETSTKEALRFYERHGFGVVETIDFPHGGIRMWAMKRESTRNRSSQAS
jgi:ribosomal protein S18 acetylase RimI-like enzyme